MGADLYIRSIHKGNYTIKSGAEYGYFRDCYNGSGLFAQLDLSWWQDVGALLDSQDDKGSDGLSVENTKKLLAMVKSREIKLCTPEELKKAGCKVDDGTNSPEAWKKSWDDWKDQLVEFLEKAIELEEPVICSI